jgi:hypothetical protein
MRLNIGLFLFLVFIPRASILILSVLLHISFALLLVGKEALNCFVQFTSFSFCNIFIGRPTRIGLFVSLSEYIFDTEIVVLGQLCMVQTLLFRFVTSLIT